MIVFLLSGLWHGAAISFIIWGALHGIIQLVEKQLYKDRIKDIEKSNGFRAFIHIVVTFLIVNFAWIFFRLPFGEAVTALKTIFTSFIGSLYLGQGLTNIKITLLCLLIMIIKEFVETNKWSNNIWHNYTWVRWSIYYVLAFSIMIFGTGSSESFIYYQF